MATEANVPIFSFKGSELDEVEKIRDLFEVFHDTNDDTGSCVIFIDDIETLGCKFKHDIKFIHCVRGQSGFYNLALTEENMQNKFDLKLSVYSLGFNN